MKTAFAAIWYTVDQNEPSHPFVLELDLPEDPTLAQITDKLLAHATDDLAEEEEESKELDGDDYEEPGEWSIEQGFYGDLALTRDETTYLIVGLPTSLKKLVKVS